ncbi:hypothetical protein CIRG_03928 [Coccidioides immitis RMSCC 2394]|uniref:Uncharacterized protein n=1 Tax=Coccidioides immitis RMSCC 2394 TaxID=404692 RepID=A0A0J6YBR3_COCIT|nr:hypothetical protein CIRG_03928 [Coccidioides immitis RMSCC 2394]
MTFTGSSQFAFRTKESRSKMPFFRQQNPCLAVHAGNYIIKASGKLALGPVLRRVTWRYLPKSRAPGRSWETLRACTIALGGAAPLLFGTQKRSQLMSKLISSGARSFINDVEQGVTNSVHQLGFASVLNLPCQNNNSHQLTRHFHVRE